MRLPRKWKLRFLLVSIIITAMLLWHNKSTVLQPQDTSITVNVSVINNKTRDLEREPEDKVEFQQTDTGSENCYAAIHLNQTTIHTPYKIYIYDLPTKYNKNLLGCRHHMFHFEQCVYGPTLHKEPGVIFTDTCQFTLDVILHHNLLFSPYRTLNPEEADVFYVPFYGAVHCFCRSGEQLESRLITEINRFPYYRQGKPHILSVGKIEKEQSSTTCPLLLQEWTWNTTALGIESYYFKRLPLTDEKRHRMRNAPRGYPKFVVVPYPSYVHFDEPSGGHYHNGIYSHKRRVFVFLAAGDGRFNPFRNIIVDKLPTKTRMSPEAYYTSEQHPATRNLSNMWLIVPGSGMLVNTTIQWMRESVFCLQPPGYSPTRKSIYDGILCGCIPVFFEWDYIPIVNYPFQDTLDYSKFSVTIPMNATTEFMEILEQYKSNTDKVKKLQKNLHEVMPMFQYSYPLDNKQHTDAMQMILDEIGRIHGLP